MTDSYLYIIIALLPLAAMMVVFQTNPYHALVIRGVLGAIAALVYSILGAPDVALTEALVGTLLAITLYAVAVRSSLVLTIGVLQTEFDMTDRSPDFQTLMSQIKTSMNPYHVRVELIPYEHVKDLTQALKQQEIHATLYADLISETATSYASSYQLVTRLSRIYELVKPNFKSALVLLNSTDLEGVKS
jgi:putative multicomponent Na+:H+ antiporter subunit B